MTTIVYDGESIVSDSRSSLGDEIYEEDCQKIFPNVGPFAVLAVAGNYQDAMDIIDTIQEYNRIDHIRGLDFKELGWNCAMLAITKDGKLWHYAGHKSFELRPDLPFAIGSGAPYALGALYMGASAQDAIAAASRFDMYTNNVVQIASLKDSEGEETEETEETEEPVKH